MSKFEIYQSRDNYYRWRLKAANGEIVATSEGYASRSNATRSAEHVKAWSSNFQIVDLY